MQILYFCCGYKNCKGLIFKRKKSIKIKIYTYRKKLYILKNGRIKKELNL